MAEDEVSSFKKIINSKEKVMLFGAGSFGQKMLNVFQGFHMNIGGFYDNDP